MNLEPEFNTIILSESADLVNHVCELAGIKGAEKMNTISMATRTAFRLAMYRCALVTVEKWHRHVQNMQRCDDKL